MGTSAPVVNDWQTVPTAPANDWETIHPAHQEALGLLKQAKSIEPTVRAVEEETLPDQAKFVLGAVKGGGQAVKQFWNGANLPAAAYLGMQKPQQPTDLTPHGAIETAGSIAGLLATPGIGDDAIAGVQNLANKVNPTAMKEAAGGLLQSVAHDANKVPVQLNNAGDGALDLMNWQKKTQLGPTVNKFLNRITNPKQGPLTYEEARDYYQLLGKLSVDETNRLAPPVRRSLVQMVTGLKQDIGNAADQVGHAADYYKGMQDYAKAAKYQQWYDSAKDWAIKAGLGAAGVGGLGTLWKQMQK